MESDEILSDLECFVCKEYLYIPVKQCSTGHSLCENCYSKVSQCPVCKVSKSSSRNFALEGILLKVLFPCKYTEYGCKVRENGPSIRQHQLFCEFGEQPCPLRQSSKCTWVGRPKDLKQHAKENHEQHPPVTNNTNLKIRSFKKKLNNLTCFHMVVACDQLFKYCVNINITSGYVLWSVQFVGPRNEASNYSYALSFIDCDQRKEKYSIASTCRELVDDQLAFNNSSCIIVHNDKLYNFCDDDGSLVFYFSIFFTKDFEKISRTSVDNHGETPGSNA